MKITKTFFLSIVLLIIGLITFNSHLIAQWYYVGNPQASVFSFPNMNTGYVTSDGIVKKTTNAGISWQTVLNLNLLYGESLGLFFITPEKGWLSADDDKLYQTRNGGITWNEIINMGSSGRQIFFADELHGWARNYSNFYRTTDGGQSWSYHLFGFYATPCNLFFINANTGWIGNYNNLSTTVQKTTDGGLTWIPKQNLNIIFYDIYFVNELTGWGAGYAGQIFKTTDGGETWIEQNSNVGHTIDRIFMINAMTGWVGTNYSWGGSSNMAYTTNGGDNWIAVLKPENLRVTDLKFFGSTGIGYLIMGGKLYKTVNNGITSRNLQLTTLLEGHYDVQSNSMIGDTVIVYLKNIFSPYTIVDSAKGFLNSSGIGSFNFLNAVNGISYYLVIKHRNSIETWSASGNSFISNSLFYNYTTSSSQAYGNNLKLKGTRWTIHSGDVNQDGIVDVSDISAVDNDSYNLVSGYVITDLNGDEFVDATDLSLVDNNSFSFVGVIRP